MEPDGSSPLSESGTAKNQQTLTASQQSVSCDRPVLESPSSQSGLSPQEQTERGLALLAAIVESSDDAIISCDLNGTVTSWNRGAERTFGYTAEEMVGQATSKLASPSCQEDTELVLEKIRHGETVDHYETTRRHKDGSDIIVSMTVSPIRDHSGKLIGASKVSRDITSTRRAEQALRNSEKLSVAGRMAASIAHEINNPLEAITNLLYLVEHERLSEEARSYLTLAQHELARVSHIASQTLGFFRSTQGLAATQLNEIADSAISLHLGRLTTCNVVVQKEYLPQQAIFVHEGELRQVLVNLVGNALDAMPAGGRLRIRIREASHPATGIRGVRIVVADTGTGMSSTTRRQLFEPFYTTKGAVGTGLGLWVSSQIVSRHKGRISVRSNQSPGHSGTVFSIFLPHLEEIPAGTLGDASSLARQLPLPIAENLTSPEGESGHTPAEPAPRSTVYTAA